MSQARSKSVRTNIPQHIKRAVTARDGNRCRRCGVVTEFAHFDHLIPVDLGGPTTEENIQVLCPKCNTSKGNNIQCRSCGHWSSPDKPRCTRCETPLLYTKYSKTFRGRVERVVQKVGVVAIIGIGAGALLLFVVGASVAAYYLLRANDQAATVNTIVNNSFGVSHEQPTSFNVVIPKGAKNSRIVGGFKVTSGTTVSFYILSEQQFAQWSSGTAQPTIVKREIIGSTKIRQPLVPGSYYLLFASPDPNNSVTVAAELYVKYD
jgi:hypothetical protein